jgi:hypothetical protein
MATRRVNVGREVTVWKCMQTTPLAGAAMLLSLSPGLPCYRNDWGVRQAGEPGVRTWHAARRPEETAADLRAGTTGGTSTP